MVPSGSSQYRTFPAVPGAELGLSSDDFFELAERPHRVLDLLALLVGQLGPFLGGELDQVEQDGVAVGERLAVPAERDPLLRALPPADGQGRFGPVPSDRRP